MTILHTCVPYVPTLICPFCGFDRREGDAHMVWFDPMPNRPDALPKWGCGITEEVQQPQQLAIISSTTL